MDNKLKVALDILEDVINQACRIESTEESKGYYLDSIALSAYAEGLRFLAKYGRVEIKTEYGRRVIAKFIEKEE